ncbi:MAG: 4Fe-4S binding protein [Desulfomicrobium escambiense]|nr:4Fe-4S binding protein [Desulfomicrobium escambiense]
MRPFKETVKVDIGEPFGRIEHRPRGGRGGRGDQPAQAQDPHHDAADAGGEEPLRLHRRPRQARVAHAQRRRPRACSRGCSFRSTGPSTPRPPWSTASWAWKARARAAAAPRAGWGCWRRGASAPAVDAAVCRLVGYRPEELPTHQAARGSWACVAGRVDIDGDFLPVSGFKLPVLAPLTFGPQRFAPADAQAPGPAPRRSIAATCRLCGECWRYCPAKAITPYAETVGFDYDRCIRCYCCVEMCPHGALKAVETPAGRARAQAGRPAGPHRPARGPRRGAPPGAGPH